MGRGPIAAAATAMLLCIAISAPADAADSKPWRHGLIEAKSDAGIFFMVGQGFAAKQGVTLELDQFKSDSIGVKALIAGEIDSLESTLTGTVVAASRGIDVKLLGCHWPGLPHGVFVRGTIAAPQDLKGKTFAISTPFSLPDVLARALLAKYGMPLSEVRLVNLGGDTDRYRALAAGLADATVISNEYTPIAAKDGISELLPGRAILPDYLRLCIFSTGKVLAARRGDAIRFLAAEMTALRYAMTHRDDTLALTRTLADEKPDDPRPAYIYDDAVKTGSVDPELGIPLAKIDWMEQELIREGNLSGPYDMKKMIDPGIREEALKSAGKGS